MRLYKYISPVLLMVLIFSVTINTSDFSSYDLGRNYVRVDSINNTGTLKKQIDDKIRIKNGPLRQANATANKMVQTAYKEIGNVGGEKYWSWYGFGSHQPWCGCFVSWCAEQNGLIENDIIPKFSGVSYGASWFMARDQWAWGDEIPAPGMIVFFDFTNMDLENVRDGITDHVGIVEKVEDGYVYCIEGNYKNNVEETMYEIGHYSILGYGMPNY